MALWYADPNGAEGAAGTEAAPYDLAEALDISTSSVAAGDTLYLRGGTYCWPTRSTGTGGSWTQINGYPVSLAGSAGSPITIRPYPGERAIIDGGMCDAGAVNPPAYLIIRDLEVLVSENVGDGRTTTVQPYPTNLERPWGGFWFENGDNLIFANNIVHACLQGISIWANVSNVTVYGNLIYDNGWDGTAVAAPNNRMYSHGTYQQNATDTWRYLTNNFLVDNWRDNVQIYSSGATAVDYFDVRDNIAYTPTTGNKSDRGRMMIGAYLCDHFEIHHNWSYHSTGIGVGYGNDIAKPMTDIVVHGNRAMIAPGDTEAVCEIYDRYYDEYTFTDNWMYKLAKWRYNDSLIGTEVTKPSWVTDWAEGTPSGPWTKLTANTYDTTRAHIAIKTFASEATADLTVTGFLSAGDEWHIQHPADFYGDPIASGTCAGATITLTMDGDWFAGVLFNDGPPPSHGVERRTSLLGRNAQALLLPGRSTIAGSKPTLWGDAGVNCVVNTGVNASWTFRGSLSSDYLNRIFIASTGATAPALNTSGLNGLTTLEFGGNDHVRNVLSFVTGFSGRVVAVAKTTETATEQVIYSQSKLAAADQFIKFGISANNHIWYEFDNGAGVTEVELEGTTDLGTDWHVLEWSSNGYAISLRVDGYVETITVVGGTNAGQWFSDVTDTDIALIGARRTSSTYGDFLTGSIAHLLIYTLDKTDGAAAKVRRSVAAKYALTLTALLMLAGGLTVTLGDGLGVLIDGAGKILVG